MKIFKWIILFISSFVLWALLYQFGHFIIPYDLLLMLGGTKFYYLILLLLIIYSLYKLTKLDFGTKNKSSKSINLFFIIFTGGVTLFSFWKVIYVLIFDCFNSCGMAGLSIYLYLPLFIIFLIITIILIKKYNNKSNNNSFNL